jgi:diguanylate cyclase (GGDEF)-like protein
MKAINDTYGHFEGDQALVDVANILRGTFRASDVVARAGGDEFCVLLLGDGPRELHSLGRLEDAVRARNQHNARPYALSLSIGTAYREPTDQSPIQTLIERADAVMYREKSRRPHVLQRLVQTWDKT